MPDDHEFCQVCPESPVVLIQDITDDYDPVYYCQRHDPRRTKADTAHPGYNGRRVRLATRTKNMGTMINWPLANVTNKTDSTILFIGLLAGSILAQVIIFNYISHGLLTEWLREMRRSKLHEKQQTSGRCMMVVPTFLQPIADRVLAPVYRALNARRKQKVRLEMLRALPKDGVGIEIGVWRGEHALDICRIARPRLLYCVDPYSGEGINDARRRADVKTAYREARLRLRHHPVIFTLATSQEAAAGIGRHGPVDYVYVDGDHSAEAVYQDLVLYWPLVKPCGVLFGDDYGNERVGGVRAAVDTFCYVHGIQPRIVGSQFWIHKC